MDRKQLKALSWSQMIDKIWMLLLILLIVGTITSAASSIIGSIIGFPIGFVAGILGAASGSPEASSLIISLASSFAGLIAAFLSILVSAPLTVSLFSVFLKTANGNSPEVVDAFSGFKKYWRNVCVILLHTVFIFLWSLLFLVPGIIKSYSYTLAPYIAAEHPELSPLECITKSKEMMNGHKAELFVLDLSFIGWGLLTVVSCGIAGIWFIPYYYTTHANFYKQLKGEI